MRSCPVPPTTIQTAKEAIQRTCERMVTEHLVIGSAGNVSIRLGDRIVVSAGGVPYEYLEPGDHPVVTLADGRAEGPLKPTSEMPLHLGIMREMDDVSAIVHTHSRYAAAFAAARQDVPFVCNENLGVRADRILVTKPYAAPASAELAEVAIKAFLRQPGSRAVLLANHGVVAIGETVEDACLVAAQAEWAAEVAYLARTLGGEIALSADELAWFGRNYGVTIAREIA
ncbi:MAG: class II aldolase/adducin family protein [Acidimicrobiales bacterium]